MVSIGFGRLLFEMFKNLLDYVRILNAGNHFDMPSTVLANLNINIEDSLKSLHPCHGVVPLFRGLIEPVSIGCFWFVRLFSAFSRCDLNTVLAVWGEDTVESGKIDARLGYQRGELCDKVQGLKDDVGRPQRATWVRCSEPDGFSNIEVSHFFTDPYQDIENLHWIEHTDSQSTQGGVCHLILVAEDRSWMLLHTNTFSEFKIELHGSKQFIEKVSSNA